MQGDTTQWDQYFFGKRIIEPDGDIVPGMESGLRGASDAPSYDRATDIQRNIRKFCDTRIIGMGFDDWQDSSQAGPWHFLSSKDSEVYKKSGGITVTPYCADGNWYIVAARIRLRRERPAYVGRTFELAHYAVHSIDGVNPALPNFLDRLHTRPMVKGEDYKLPKLEIPDDAGAKLPDGWFKQVRPMLEDVLCGKPHCEIDRALESRDEFYQHARRALACLPAVLRWRLPIAAGAFRVKPDIAFGQGAAIQEIDKSEPSAAVKAQAKQVLAEIEDVVTDPTNRPQTLDEVCQAIDFYFGKSDHGKGYDQQLFEGETLSLPQGGIGQFWKNSVGRFRSELCEEPWVDEQPKVQPEVKKPEPPKAKEPENKPRWRLPKIFGGAVLATVASGYEASQAGETPIVPPTQPWVERVDNNANGRFKNSPGTNAQSSQTRT